MRNVSRRDFLKLFGSATATLLLGRHTVFAGPLSAEPFEFLVVGDSLVWGQGLEEKDKFYSLTAEWLRNDIFNRQREVNLKVKAHSGSTLTFHADEAEKYKRVGRDETYYYKPEVNVAFPSIWKQIDVAADEYGAAGRAGADLIMLTGGITDITVSTVLDPFGDNAKLPPLIEKYCRDDMFKVLEHAARHNANALIAVVGYFPMLSPKTPTSKLFNNWLESMSFPRFLKPLANNPIIRPLFLNGYERRASPGLASGSRNRIRIFRRR